MAFFSPFGFSSGSLPSFPVHHSAGYQALPYASSTLGYGSPFGASAFPAAPTFPFGAPGLSPFGSPFPASPFPSPFSFPGATALAPAPSPPASTGPAQAPAAESGHLAVESGQKPGSDVCWTLIYWPVRGLGAPIRMLLTYGGAIWDDQIVSASEWFGPDGMKEKLATENPFVNLPLFEDGALVLAQSSSILRHVARKMNLIGCSEITSAKCDMLLDQLLDLRTQYSRVMYGTSKEQYPEEAAKHFGETAKAALQKFSDWFALNGTQFLVENHPTVADFVLWELVDVHLLAAPSILDDLPRLAEFHSALRAVPQLAKYFESEAATYPPNGPSANWNA